MASAEVQSINRSLDRILLWSSHELLPGALVFLQAVNGVLAGSCVVRHCTCRGDGYGIGLEFNEETKATSSVLHGHDVDYYEFLQVSPKADLSTIQRIHRILVSRFHPDNPETGDPEKFLILQEAHAVLSDPARRAAYDASLQSKESGTLPIFELSEFVNGIEGENNRRLGIMALLYNRRRTSPQSPGVSLFDLERRMGMPREYLDFTTWYLKSKGYITVADNSEFALTASGVDYVESNCPKIPILQRLLDSGPRCATSSAPVEANAPAEPFGARLLVAPSATNPT
jgi:hypothetical protein